MQGHHEFLRAVISDEAEAIYTENTGYDGIADENTRHETVKQSQKQWERAKLTRTPGKTCWSLFKRSIFGSYHHLSVKHRLAYLDEWRYVNTERTIPVP